MADVMEVGRRHQCAVQDETYTGRLGCNLDFDVDMAVFIHKLRYLRYP